MADLIAAAVAAPVSRAQVPHLHIIAAAGLQSLGFVTFLIKELVASPTRKFAQLQRYFPPARRNEWALIPAGQ